MTSARLTLPGREGPIRYSIEHRPRVTRRLHLELDDAGELRVVVPRGWPDFYTRRLLDQHLDLVHRFLARARKRQLPALSWSAGATHLYRGEPLVLALEASERKRPAVRRDGTTLTVQGSVLDEASVRRAVQTWYRRESERLFQARLDARQAITPWAAERRLTLALRRMKRTWGTCSRDGVIRLNTHLVKAPPHLLDYVISHELCHLQEMNHGPAFYALQSQLWPAWREHRQELREHGHRYTQE